MAKLFYLVKKGKYWYCRYPRVDGKNTGGVSTKCTTKSAAEKWAVEHLDRSRVRSPEMRLERFADGFFSEGSSYVVNRRAEGRSVKESVLRSYSKIYAMHVAPALGVRKLLEIDKGEVRSFREGLIAKGLSGASINQILQILSLILREAEDQDLIPRMPRIPRVALNVKPKGILSSDEVRRLFALEWEDKRAYVANVLAAHTGMRISEVAALTPAKLDVRRNVISVDSNYEYRYGTLTPTTKNKVPRLVPVVEGVMALLLELVEDNPHRPLTKDSWIFYSTRTDKPMGRDLIGNALKAAMERIGVDWKGRNITFHSWRNYAVSNYVNTNINQLKVQKIIGHSGEKMTKRYLRQQESFEDVIEIQKTILGD